MTGKTEGARVTWISSSGSFVCVVAQLVPVTEGAFVLAVWPYIKPAQTLGADGVLPTPSLGTSLGSSGGSLIAMTVSITPEGSAFSSPNQNNHKAALVTPQRLCAQGRLQTEYR